MKSHDIMNTIHTHLYKCGVCNGKGRLWKGFFRKPVICEPCMGKGVVSVPPEVEVPTVPTTH